MSPGWSRLVTAWQCFPRVSGDEPGMEPFSDCMAVFSPRERG